MRFLSFVLRNLTRRPVRSALTVSGMALAVGAVVALVGISYGFQRSFLDMYEQRGVDLVVVRAGASQRLTSALDETLADRIRALPGVRDVTPGLMDVVSFEDLDLYGVVVQGWARDSFLFDQLHIIEGRVMRPDEPRGILLGKILAKNLGKGAGETLEVVEEEPYEIVGVYETFNVYENGAIVMLLPELQRLMDRQGQVSGFTVMADDPNDTEAIAALATEIEGLARGLTAMAAKDFAESTTQIKLAKTMSWVISLIVLVLGTIGMLNTMAMSVFERTQEIGILRGIGWRKGRVVRMILWESGLLSLCGAVVGTAGALVLLIALSRFRLTNGLIEGRIEPWVLCLGFVVAAGVALLGGAYPAYRGARLLPTEALRHE